MNTHHNVKRTTVLLLCAAGLLTLAACNRSDPMDNRPAAVNAPLVNTPSVAMAPTSPANTMSSSADSDRDITTQVEGSLAQDDMLRSQSIDVDTNDGAVRLRGSVDTQAQREHALVVARAVTGVREVQDELTLKR